MGTGMRHRWAWACGIDGRGRAASMGVGVRYRWAWACGIDGRGVCGTNARGAGTGLVRAGV
jgi:hypothetical protein